MREEERTRKEAFLSPLPLAAATTNVEALQRRRPSWRREGEALGRAGGRPRVASEGDDAREGKVVWPAEGNLKWFDLRKFS